MPHVLVLLLLTMMNYATSKAQHADHHKKQHRTHVARKGDDITNHIKWGKDGSFYCDSECVSRFETAAVLLTTTAIIYNDK